MNTISQYDGIYNDYKKIKNIILVKLWVPFLGVLRHYMPLIFFHLHLQKLLLLKRVHIFSNITFLENYVQLIKCFKHCKSNYVYFFFLLKNHVKNILQR